MLEKLDFLRYTRNGEELEKLVSANSSDKDMTGRKLKKAIEEEYSIYKIFKLAENNLHGVQQSLESYLANLNFDKSEYSDEEIDTIFLPIFCAELLDKSDIKFKFLMKLQDSYEIESKSIWETLKNQPYRLRCFVELYLTKLLNDSKNEDPSVSLKKFEGLSNIILKYVVEDKTSKTKYQSFRKSDKVIFFVCLWKLLSLLDRECVGLEKFKRKLSLILTFCRSEYKTEISEHNKIILLHALNTTVIPLLEQRDLPEFSKISPRTFKEYVEFMAPENSFKLGNFSSQISWKQFVMANFCILHQIIAKRTEMTYKLDHSDKEAISLDNINEIISPFCTVNLNVYRNSLKSLAKEIIDSKGLVLFSNFLIEHSNSIFSREILERNFLQPFDDSLLLKKLLCFLHYKDEEYIKCYQLLKQLLEKNHPNEPSQITLNFIGSLLCLKYLDKPEEALMYAKSNLFSLEKSECQKLVLPKYSLYMVAAFCYQRMGGKAPFFKQRLDLWAKSIEYFEKSYQINKYEPNVLFNLALMHSQILNLDDAMKFNKEAYTTLNANFNAYLLLILNYTAQGEWKKAGQIVEELIASNQKHPLLYIFKAGIVANGILSKETKMIFYESDESLGIDQVNHPLDENESNEVAEEIYSLIKASAGCLLELQLSELPTISELEGKLAPNILVDYQKILILGVDILVKIRSWAYAETIIELTKAKNLHESEYLYYKGLIHHNKEEYDKAISFYESAIFVNSNSSSARLQLGMIYLDVPKHQNFAKAEKYLYESYKFEETPEILYLIGRLHGCQGQSKRSSEYLLKAIETIYKKTVLPYSILSTEILLD